MYIQNHNEITKHNFIPLYVLKNGWHSICYSTEYYLLFVNKDAISKSEIWRSFGLANEYDQTHRNASGLKINRKQLLCPFKIMSIFSQLTFIFTEKKYLVFCELKYIFIDIKWILTVWIMLTLLPGMPTLNGKYV